MVITILLNLYQNLLLKKEDKMKHIKLFENYNKEQIFYHGTQDVYDVYDVFGNNYEGTYFTDNQSVAEDYGDIIIKAYLEMNNPLILDTNGENWIHFEGRDLKITNAIKNLHKEGHDSIIVKNIVDHPCDDQKI